MRTHLSRSVFALTGVALGLLVGGLGARAQEQPSTTMDGAGLRVLGVRAQVSTARCVVLLEEPPSLAGA